MDDICSVKKRGRDLTVDSLDIAEKQSVRDIIILTPSDALKKSVGKAVFKFSYRVGNAGYMSSKDFENLTYFNDKVVSRQQGLALGPNEYKVIKDKITLDTKDGEILVRIDAFSRIAEDDETNNDISAKILFRGFKSGSPAGPFLHIERMRIAGRTPVQGRVKLTKKQSLGEKKGRHAFAVEFVIRNFGLKTAKGFDNMFLINGKRFYRQRNLTLAPGESRLVEENVYFPTCNGKLTVRVDGNSKYPKGKECKQIAETQLYFQGFARV